MEVSSYRRSANVLLCAKDLVMVLGQQKTFCEHSVYRRSTKDLLSTEESQNMLSTEKQLNILRRDKIFLPPEDLLSKENLVG